jgi:hypothetical protein
MVPSSAVVKSTPSSRAALTPGGRQIGYMGDQKSTYGFHSLPGGGVRLAVINWMCFLLSSTGCVFYALLGLLHSLPGGRQIGYVDYTGRHQLLF